MIAAGSVVVVTHAALADVAGIASETAPNSRAMLKRFIIDITSSLAAIPHSLNARAATPASAWRMSGTHAGRSVPHGAEPYMG